MTHWAFSEHAQHMLREPDIQERWVRAAPGQPDKTERQEDGTTHYIKAIKEYGGRHLRVVLNPDSNPPRIVTLFFDRRLGRMV